MSCKALREQMQSFTGANAKLCGSKCKALRGQLQSFALADAKLCVRDGLNRKESLAVITAGDVWFGNQKR